MERVTAARGSGARDRGWVMRLRRRPRRDVARINDDGKNGDPVGRRRRRDAKQSWEKRRSSGPVATARRQTILGKTAIQCVWIDAHRPARRAYYLNLSRRRATSRSPNGKAHNNPGLQLGAWRFRSAGRVGAINRENLAVATGFSHRKPPPAGDTPEPAADSALVHQNRHHGFLAAACGSVISAPSMASIRPSAEN